MDDLKQYEAAAKAAYETYPISGVAWVSLTNETRQAWFRALAAAAPLMPRSDEFTPAQLERVREAAKYAVQQLQCNTEVAELVADAVLACLPSRKATTMKRRLFDEYEATTAEGIRLGEDVGTALFPIVKAAMESGASMRDVESIIHSEVTCMIAEDILRASIKQREAECGWKEATQ